MFQRYLERSGYSSSSAPSTNSTLWSLKIGGAVRSSPAVDEGLVFVGSDDFKLYCLDQNSGAVVWSFTTEGAIESSSAVFEEFVFVGSGDGKLYCLDKASGSFRWSYQTMGRVSSSPAVYGYRVVFSSENQRVYCLNAQDGTLVWSYRTEGPIHSSPAIANNRVFVGSSDGKVYCLDLVTGSPIWSFFVGASIRSSPAVSDGRVYVGARDGKIYCLNETNGDLIWSYRTEGAVESSPAFIFEGRVYVGSLDHRVYCLNGSTGSLIWSYLTGGEVWSSPAVADGKVFIGSNDGKLYCLNATTGVPVWSYDTGEAVISSPAVADGKVFVGSLSGEVYAFGVKVHSLKISATSPHLANGEDKSKVTVTALDGQGSPLAGASLILGLSMFLDHKETFIPSDLGNGTYVAYVGSVFAGEALIIVTDLVTKISENTTVTFEACSICTLNVYASNPREEDPKNTSEIIISPLDIFNNLIPPSRIKLKVTSDMGTLSQITYDRNGHFYINLTTSQVGIANLTLSATDTLYEVSVNKTIQILFPTVTITLPSVNYYLPCKPITASVNIFVPPGRRMSEYYLEFTFNNSVIQLLNVTDGDPYDAFPAPIYGKVDCSSGWITQRSEEGAKGSVEVAKITFSPVGVGNTTISVTYGWIEDTDGELISIEPEAPAPIVFTKVCTKKLCLNINVLKNKTGPVITKEEVKKHVEQLKKNFKNTECMNVEIEWDEKNGFKVIDWKPKQTKDPGWLPSPIDSSKGGIYGKIANDNRLPNDIVDLLRQNRKECCVNVYYVEGFEGLSGGLAVSPNDYPKYKDNPGPGIIVSKDRFGNFCINFLKHELGHLLLDYEGATSALQRDEHCFKTCPNSTCENYRKELSHSLTKCPLCGSKLGYLRWGDNNFMYIHSCENAEKISEEQRNWICRCTNPFLKKVEAKHGKHSETNCTFKMFEDVYIVGAYFTPSKTMDVYLIPDGSKPVVENAIAVVTVTTDEVGRIPSTYLWSVNQAGNFDIWVDYNRNGEYDYGEYIDDEENGLYFLTSITHNIAITNVTYNYEVGIAVEIENEGGSTETFWICVSYTINEEKYPIATQQLTLPADTKTNVNFEWIPEVIGPYELHVEVTKVLWEADLTDNVYTLTIIEAG